MKKVLSIRELALFGILVILAAYFFVVQGPLSKQREELLSEQRDLQRRMEVCQPQLNEMNKMQAELDQVYADADGKPQALAPYSNNKILLQELNLLLNIADSFNVTFGEETLNDTVMRREIEVNFETQTEEAAEFIVQSIEESKNTYLVTGFSSNTDDKRTRWTSSLSLVNYEYVTPEQAAELTAKGVKNESKKSGVSDGTSAKDVASGENIYRVEQIGGVLTQ